MTIGLLVLYLFLPGCTSLKEKRSRIKPILAKLPRVFNLSIAEVDRQDAWQEAVLACAMVSNDRTFTTQALQEVVKYVESHWPDEQLVESKVEFR